MPVNRNALIRFKAIDQCLRNRRRKWTLEDLIEKVSEALYEFEGIGKGISKRTIQADIQMMRSNKLGYNAPIVIVDRKYYTYEDPLYSITNLPLNESDFSRMSEAVEVLKQFKGFSHFKNLSDIVQKLEGHVYASANAQKVIVDFEKNEQLKGLEHLSCVYDAIAGGQIVEIEYQSFKARKSSRFQFHPWWLKEFKNRWFVVGVKDDQPDILTLALDRMQAVQLHSGSTYRSAPAGCNAESYYADVIGVTVSSTLRPENVHLAVSWKHAPYVLTKPLHHSQKEVERTTSGLVISLQVQLNYELEKEILGFGDGISVLQPARLRKSIQHRLRLALDSYEEIAEAPGAG